MRITFECTEAQYEPHHETGEPPVSLEQPSQVVIDVPGAWVQITYETLRVPKDGDMIAFLGNDSGFWEIYGDWPVRSATKLDGTELQPALVKTSDMKFTDVIID